MYATEGTPKGDPKVLYEEGEPEDPHPARRLGFIPMLFAMCKSHPSTTDCYLRKDKYQKKLIWYWCDVAYEGTKANRDEEELLRDTTISDGARVRDVALGLGASLPDLDSQDEADNDADDDEDEDEEDDEEADEPKAKLGKRKSKENLPDDVEEATSIPLISFCALPEP